MGGLRQSLAEYMMATVTVPRSPQVHAPVASKQGRVKQQKGGGSNMLGMSEGVRTLPRHGCIHLDVSSPGHRAYQFQSIVEAELTYCRIYGKFFVAGTILRTYIPAYTALAIANSSESRAAVRTIMLLQMPWLVSIITTVLLHTINLTNFNVSALRTRTEALLQCEACANPPCNTRQRSRFSSPDCRPSLAQL